MTVEIGKFVRAQVAEGVCCYGRVLGVLDGVTRHFVLDTVFGPAYVSDGKILDCFPCIIKGQMIRWWDAEGSCLAGSVEAIRVQRNTVVLYTKTLLTGQVVPVPIQLVEAR